jgi:hypothetical protein
MQVNNIRTGGQNLVGALRTLILNLRAARLPHPDLKVMPEVVQIAARYSDSLRATVQVNRPQRTAQTALVRLENGVLEARVSSKVAETLLSSGVARRVGKNKLRYIQREPGILIPESFRCWALIEDEQRNHGDSVVRRGMISFDRRPLSWDRPKPKSAQSAVERVR